MQDPQEVRCEVCVARYVHDIYYVSVFGVGEDLCVEDL